MGAELSTADRVASLIKEHLILDSIPAQDENLIDDLNADSLDMVEVCMSMEDEFGIKVSDDEAGKCSTVGDWTSLVERKLAA